MSRPAWARGLKRYVYGLACGTLMSRPAWARGLKHICLYYLPSVHRRALRGRVD